MTEQTKLIEILDFLIEILEREDANLGKNKCRDRLIQASVDFVNSLEP